MWWCYCFFNRQGGFEERATAKSATSEMPFFVNMLHGAYQQEKGCLGKKDWLTFNKSMIQILAYSILDKNPFLLVICLRDVNCFHMPRNNWVLCLASREHPLGGRESTHHGGWVGPTPNRSLEQASRPTVACHPYTNPHNRSFPPLHYAAIPIEKWKLEIQARYLPRLPFFFRI